MTIEVEWARLTAPELREIAGRPGAMAVLPIGSLEQHGPHLPFGGTITLDYDTLSRVLRCIARSLKALGFARLLIVNGHGGNIDPLAVAARELAVTFAIPIVATTPWMHAAAEVAAIAESET